MEKVTIEEEKMHLDYLHHVNEYDDNIIRLYDFGMDLSIQFHQLLVDYLNSDKKELSLSEQAFIEARNCNLILRISDEDLGIDSDDGKTFYCDLTHSSFLKMADLILPFTKKESKGFQYLYDLDNPTDFLFSPNGSSNI